MTKTKLKKMKISKNFRMVEFSVSGSYPYLAAKVPLNLHCNVTSLVLGVLQPICDATGWSDTISSGYRSPALNKAVGGSPTSDHAKARASDNNFFKRIAGRRVEVSPYEVAKKIIELKLDFDQVILYPTFIHIGYRVGANRNMLLYSKNYKGRKL